MIVKIEAGETCPICKAKVARRTVSYMYHTMNGCWHTKMEVVVPVIDRDDQRNKMLVHFN